MIATAVDRASYQECERLVLLGLRSAVLLALGLALPLCMSAEQSGAPLPGHQEEARTFAPILWLTPGELAYPMRPLPFAFDGIDNDEDGCYDLDDPDEVDALELRPGESKKEKLRELEDLLRGLRLLRNFAREAEGDLSADEVAAKVEKEAHRLNLVATPQPACHQQVRKLAAFKLCEKVGKELECGPGAALLFNYRTNVSARDVQASTLRPGLENLSALQYWMYYPWDQEHLHDGEHVSVFFTPGTGGAPSRVEAVVGAGHLPSTANNVLAIMEGRPHPSSIPFHMPVLVEMGKHSSAPDFNCNGAFDIGQDANFLSTGAWGTRDLNYAIGKGQWNKYMSWYSFDRADGTLLLEEDANRSAYLRSCPEHSLGGILLKEVAFPAQGQAGSAQATNQADSARTAQVYVTKPKNEERDRHVSMPYVLIDAEAFKGVLNAPPAELKARLFGMQGQLFPKYRQPWKTPADVTYDQALAKRVEALASAGVSSDPRPDVWKHSDYGKYGNDFKAGLFRTFSWGPSYTVENGNSRWGLFARFVPRGADSSWELHLWADRLAAIGETPAADADAALLGEKKGRPVEVAVFYNAFSTSYRGLYGGVSFRSSDLRYTREFVVSRDAAPGTGEDTVIRIRQPRNLFAEAGYSAALPVLDKLPGLPSSLRRKLSIRPLNVRIGVAGPLHWGKATLSDAERDGKALQSDKWQQNVELRITVQLRVSNIGKHWGGHPLQPR